MSCIRYVLLLSRSSLHLENGETQMLHLMEGDVTRDVSVDAIVTLINSGGMWYGGVDGAIIRVAGQLYHSGARQAMPLTDGQVVVVEGDHDDHHGSFDDVVFVVDDLRQPLSNLLSKALQTIKSKGYTRVAMPMFRTGVMLGVVESDAHAVVDQMERAFSGFNHDGMDIFIVIYNDSRIKGLLESRLN